MSSVAKVTAEIGETLDKKRQEAEVAVYKQLGAMSAYRVGAKSVAKLYDHLEKDASDGKLLDVSCGSVSDLESYISLWIQRAVTLLENLHGSSQNDMLIAQGRVTSLQEAVALVQQHHNRACSAPVTNLAVVDGLE